LLRIARIDLPTYFLAFPLHSLDLSHNRSLHDVRRMTHMENRRISLARPSF